MDDESIKNIEGSAIFYESIKQAFEFVKYLAIPLASFIPVAGYFSKQLYLDPFKIRYADFAGYGDLTMDAIGGFSSLVVILFLSLLLTLSTLTIYYSVLILYRRILRTLINQVFIISHSLIANYFQHKLQVTKRIKFRRTGNIDQTENNVKSLSAKLRHHKSKAAIYQTRFTDNRSWLPKTKSINLKIYFWCTGLFLVSAFTATVFLERRHAGEVAHRAIHENYWNNNRSGIIYNLKDYLFINSFEPSLVGQVVDDGALHDYIEVLCASETQKYNIYFLTQNSSYTFFSINIDNRGSSLSSLILDNDSTGSFTLVEHINNPIITEHPRSHCKYDIAVSDLQKKSEEPSPAGDNIAAATIKLDQDSPILVNITNPPTNRVDEKELTKIFSEYDRYVNSASETDKFSQEVYKLQREQMASIAILQIRSEICLREWEEGETFFSKFFSGPNEHNCEELIQAIKESPERWGDLKSILSSDESIN